MAHGKKSESLKEAITMFKSIFGVVLVSLMLVVASSEVYAQEESSSISGIIEIKSEISNPNLQGVALINYAGNGKVGAYAFLQTSAGYSQAYVGATYSPNKHMQVGIAIGAEKFGDDVSPRVGAFVYAGKGRIANLTLLEGVGASGFWYRNQTSVSLPKGFTASVVNQRFAGTGPEIEYRIHKSRFSVRANVLTQSSGATFEAGLRFNF